MPPQNPSTQIRTTPDPTAEDLEANLRYNEARSRRPPTTPLTTQAFNSIFSEPQHPQRRHTAPPSPPYTPNTHTPRSPSPALQPAPALDSENPRVPPPKGGRVKLLDFCSKCLAPYAADEVSRVLNHAMTRAPGAYTARDWRAARREGRWLAFLEVLAKGAVAGREMDAWCAGCILGCVCEAQEWAGYDVERGVWRVW